MVPEALVEAAAGARTLKCVCLARQGDHGPEEKRHLLDSAVAVSSIRKM